MFRRFLSVRNPLMLIALASLQASTIQAVDPSLDAVCSQALPLQLNETLRGDASEPETIHVFRVDIPTTGVLTLDVTVPGWAEAQPKLSLLRPGCDSMNEISDPLVVERAASYQAVAVAPGTYLFRLTAQDPTSTLGEYKLALGFATFTAFERALAAPASGERQERSSPPPPTQTQPDIVDPDPGLGMPPLKTKPDIVDPDPGFAKVDPDPGVLMPPLKTKPDIVDPDPGLLGRRLPEAWCSNSLDDHADTFWCASLLRVGRRVISEIYNPLGDDMDVFRFTLTAVETLEFSSSGDTDTFGVLYDRYGQVLASDGDGGSKDNFRIVRTLPPGQYFLRVEGQYRSEGSYGLTVETLEE